MYFTIDDEYEYNCKSLNGLIKLLFNQTYDADPNKVGKKVPMMFVCDDMDRISVHEVSGWFTVVFLLCRFGRTICRH